jgi:hypothetical protein
MFVIGATSDRIWNLKDLIAFLVANQHKHIELTLDPEAICLHNLGVYDILDQFSFASVKIHTWNPLEQHDKYTIVSKGLNFWFDRVEKIPEQLHTWNKQKTFLCLYHRPTAARLGLAGYLNSHYKNLSAIHFSTPVTPDDLEQFEFDKLLKYHVPSVAPAAELLKELPLLLSSPENYTQFTGYNYSDPLTQLYQDIFLDVVVESHVAGNTFFPTEKTVRAMLMKKPFVLFASINSLDYLHQMGFRTFADFWPETYDGYESGDRLTQIYKVIDSLAQKTPDELEQLYWAMTYTLDHNYDLLQSKRFNKRIKHI